MSALIVVLLLSLLGSVIPTPRPTLAAVRTLSDLGPTNGAIRGAQVVGDYLVYRADYDVAGRFDLYSTPVNGGNITRLSVDLPPGEIEVFQAAAAHVVFTLRTDDGAKQVLYSVPITGGPVVRLNPEYTDSEVGRNPLQFIVAGDRVVYIIDQETRNVPVLYSVPISGGASTRLSVELPAVSDLPWQVRSMQVSADNSTVAYFIALQGGSSLRLYAVPVAGGDSTLLSGSDSPISEFLNKYALTPDGSRAVYLAESSTAGQRILVSVARNGSDRQVLAEDSAISFALAPDGARVAYVAFAEGASSGSLKSVAVAGGSVVDLAVDSFDNLFFSIDGVAVYFQPSTGGLRRVAVAGGTVQTVLANSTPETLIRPYFRDTGAYLVIMARNEQFDLELYSYATGGSGPAVQINDPSIDNFFGRFHIAGNRVLYEAGSFDAPPQIYSVPLAGGPSIAITPDYAEGEDISGIITTTDTQAFLGVGKRDEPGNPLRFSRLLKRLADGSNSPTVVDVSRAIVGDVWRYSVSPSDGRAVYIANQDDVDLFEAYSVPLSGGATTKLSIAGEGVANVMVNPTGGNVVIVGPNSSLYSVAIDGGNPATFSGYGTPGSIADLTFTADGEQIVFRATEGFGPGSGILYRAPATGGAATAISAGVESFYLNSDGSQVAYIVSGSPNGLRSAATSGGEPVNLGAITTGETPRFSPDGTRLVYKQGGPFGEPVALVSQLVSGGAATPLQPVTGGETLGDWAISADSSAVVYVTYNESRSILRSKPIGGGNATLLADVEAGLMRFSISPQSDRVVYAVNRQVEEFVGEVRVLSVPLSGGASTTLFPATQTGSSGLGGISISPDGATAIFSFDLELFAVPTTSGNVVQLDDPDLPFAGDFSLTTDGRIVFIDGQKLFINSLAGGALRQLSAPLPQGRVDNFELAGNTVVYGGTSYTNVGGLQELFAVDMNALTGETFKLYLPLTMK